MFLYLVTFLIQLADILVNLFLLLMFLRSICSWFPSLDDTFISYLLEEITEWVINPMRLLLDHFNADVSSSYDIPFFLTFAVFVVLSMML